jgi:hypothetical protein
MKKILIIRFCTALLAFFLLVDGHAQTKCNVDSLNYLYYKSSQFRGVALNASSSGNAFAQWYPAPQPITIHGFEFYAWQSDGTNATVTLTCNLYKAGNDSLPSGGPIRSTTITVDSTFGGGQLNAIKKIVAFSSSISLNYPYIITVENTTSTSVSVICNDYLATTPNGRKEWLSSVRIGANYLRSYNINVGGIAFDADFLLEPHVSYTLDADFTFVGCNNATNNMTFTNTSSKIISSPFYNRYAYFNILQFCHLWDFGDTTGGYYSENGLHKYNYPVNHDVTLFDTLYGWKTGCGDRQIKTVYAPPPRPTFYTSGQVCSGDTFKLWVDTVPGTKYVWTGPNGFNSNAPEIVFPQSDTSLNGLFSITAVANNCSSVKQYTSGQVHQTPEKPTTLNVGSKCVGDSVYFKASSPSAAINFIWSGPNGFTSSTNDFWFTNLDTTYRGDYVVYLDDGTCQSDYDTASLYIYPPPQPPTAGTFTGNTLCQNDTLRLKGGSVTGALFAWEGPNGFSTNATHPIIPNVTTAQAGYYSAYVMIGSCTSTADSVLITVNPKPIINISTASATTFCDGDSAILISSGDPGLTYQWKNTGVDIGTAQATNLTVKASGNYKVLATNTFACKDTSTSIPITVKPLPTITQQPYMQAIHLDWPAVFTVTADAGALYQWQENTGSGFNNLNNNSNYAGAQTNMLTVSNITPIFNNNLYRCFVSLAGCEATSDSAALTINIGIQKIINVFSFSLYPNPAANAITFEFTEALAPTSKLEVITVSGQVVITIDNAGTKANGNSVAIDISTLADGVYFCKVTGADGKPLQTRFAKTSLK